MWGSPNPPSSLCPKATTRETSRETDDEGKIVYEMSDSVVVVVVVVVVAFQEL